MGNRAIITFENEYKNNGSGLYLHWNGGRDSVELEKREVGIALACYDEDNMRLRFPIKITHDPDAVYEDCKYSKGDPNQGWETYDYDDDWLC